LPKQNGQRDYVALFVVTASEGIRDRAEKAKNEGYYFKSHGLQALAIETAEGCGSGYTGEFGRLGIPGSAGDDDGPEIYVAVPRKAL